MKTRVITAVIALPLLLAAIIFIPASFFSVLVGFFVLMGAWEWSLLCDITKPMRRTLYVIGVMLGLFAAIFLPTLLFLFLAIVAWLWIFVAILYYEKNRAPAGFQFSFVRGCLGWFVLISTWQSIV